MDASELDETAEPSDAPAATDASADEAGASAAPGGWVDSGTWPDPDGWVEAGPDVFADPGAFVDPDALFAQVMAPSAPALPSHLPLEVAERFEVRASLGSGACGDVAEAFDRQTQTRVALKLLRRELLSSRRATLRFHREVDTLKRLNHPNIVRVFNGGTDAQGHHFIAMELIEGPTLSEVLDTRNRLAAAVVARMAIKVLDALDHAHSQGIVHRDLKPGNILLGSGWESGRRGALKLVDFGVAKALDDDERREPLTHVGEAIGTPQYMAPEQISGDPLDTRADLYAMGCVIYRAVSGFAPIDGPSAFAIYMGHLEHVPVRLDTLLGDAWAPAPLAGLVEQLLAKEPDDRPASAKEVADALRGMMPMLPQNAAMHEVQAPRVVSRASLALEAAEEEMHADLDAIEATLSGPHVGSVQVEPDVLQETRPMRPVEVEAAEDRASVEAIAGPQTPEPRSEEQPTQHPPAAEAERGELEGDVAAEAAHDAVPRPADDAAPPPAPGRSMGRLVGLGALAVLLVCGVGGGVWVWMSQSTPDKATPVAQADPAQPNAAGEDKTTKGDPPSGDNTAPDTPQALGGEPKDDAPKDDDPKAKPDAGGEVAANAGGTAEDAASKGAEGAGSGDAQETGQGGDAKTPDDGADQALAGSGEPSEAPAENKGDGDTAAPQDKATAQGIGANPPDTAPQDPTHDTTNDSAARGQGLLAANETPKDSAAPNDTASDATPDAAPPKTTGEAPSGPIVVELDVQPPSAHLWSGRGRRLGTARGSVTLESSASRLLITAPGYMPQEVQLTPDDFTGDAKARVSRKLERLRGRPRAKVLIETEPSGAQVIDGRRALGPSPAFVERVVVDHVVVFKVVRPKSRKIERVAVVLTPGTTRVTLPLDSDAPARVTLP